LANYYTIRNYFLHPISGEKASLADTAQLYYTGLSLLRYVRDADTVKGRPVNINLASLKKLEILPLIGPRRAARIVSFRRTHGLFRNIDELELVPGIGKKIAEGLRGYITV
jgi:competence ComEA-like helix-hairpin-helix protein